jgi:hypothetical protein
MRQEKRSKRKNQRPDRMKMQEMHVAIFSGIFPPAGFVPLACFLLSLAFS